MAIRLPWPWENEPDPLEGVQAKAPSMPEALTCEPEEPSDGPRVTFVSYARGDIRKGMDGLQRRLRNSGADSEYARAKAIEAAQTIDRKRRG